MTYKKTWLSCLLWAVFSCITGVVLANYTIYFWYREMGIAVGYGTVFFVCLVFAVTAGSYLAIRKIFLAVSRRHRMSAHAKQMWEIFAALCIFFAAAIYRMALYLQSSNDMVMITDFYQMGTVKAPGGIEPMSHGMSFLYTACLSVIFSFLGNRITAAVLFQILIQIVSMPVLYLAVRKLAGRLPACVVMLFFTISSVYARQMLQILPEDFFFLLYLLGLLIVGSYVKSYCGGRLQAGLAVVGACMTGAVIGVLGYLDAVSLTLAVFLIGLVIGTSGNSENKEKRKSSLKFSVLLVVCSFAVGGLALMGMFLLDASLSKTSTGAIINTWTELFFPYFPFRRILYMIQLPYQPSAVSWQHAIDDSQTVIQSLILVIAAAFSIMAFWNRKKVQNISPWIVMLLLIAPTPLAVTGVLHYQIFSVFVWSVLAGIGLQNCFVEEQPLLCRTEGAGRKDAGAAKTSDAVKAGAVQQPTAAGTAWEALILPTASTKADVKEGDEKMEKPRFIENPLPLPKRHEKKEMDYQYEVVEGQMKFDVDSGENDDFDV